MNASRFLLGAAVSGFLASAGFADLFSVQVVNNGVGGGVSFSWLTTGTDVEGHNPTNEWRIEGSILVDFDAGGGALGLGSVSLVGDSQDLDIKSGGSVIGTFTIDDLFLEDPNLGGDADLLGWMEFTITSNGSDSDLDASVAPGAGGEANNTGRIEFLDKNYGGESNGFNGFSITGDILSLRLWGNEIVFDDPNFPDTMTDWGVDWSSSGQAVVPAPGAVLLGVMGLGCVGYVRRRFS